MSALPFSQSGKKLGPVTRGIVPPLPGKDPTESQFKGFGPIKPALAPGDLAKWEARQKEKPYTQNDLFEFLDRRGEREATKKAEDRSKFQQLGGSTSGARPKITRIRSDRERTLSRRPLVEAAYQSAFSGSKPAKSSEKATSAVMPPLPNSQSGNDFFFMPGFENAPRFVNNKRKTTPNKIGGGGLLANLIGAIRYDLSQGTPEGDQSAFRAQAAENTVKSMESDDNMQTRQRAKKKARSARAGLNRGFLSEGQGTQSSGQSQSSPSPAPRRGRGLSLRG